MSDRYRPPSGPKSTRKYSDDRRAAPNTTYKSSYGSKDSSSNDRYTQTGNKRYSERDNYRPSTSSHSDTYQPSHKYRPSGPSGYRSSDSRNYSTNNQPAGNYGNKRPLPPSEPKDHRNDRKRRDFSGPSGPSHYKDKSGSYRGPKFDSSSNRPKVNLSNLPKGPRSSGNFNANDMQRRARTSLLKNDKIHPSSTKPPAPKLLKSQLYSIRVTRPSEIYKKVQQVGEGTYGRVYKSKNIITDEYVALKKLRLESEREGFPITAMREIKLLQSFDHENVIGLLEMMVEHNQIYMIFDYMDHDLTGLLTHPDLNLTESHRKFIFKQLMEGLNYLHKKRVIHRDIKGSNILLDNVGRLKIADFGLARTMKIVNDGESPDYTNRVITIWYRPPELLLGSTDYGREVDIWGVGCLLIELYSKVAAFQGFEEVGQLHKIFNIMGTPTIEDWPEIENLPWFEMLKPKINKSSSFRKEYVSIMSEQSFDLARNLLKLNPLKRLTAEEALKHPYFTEDPKPEQLTFLKDIKGEWHEFETKKRRRKERKRLQDEKSNQQSQPQPPQSQSQIPLSAPESEILEAEPRD